ncbi:MAG: alpha/beta hydrolase family esterase [Phycisphaerales bacterium]
MKLTIALHALLLLLPSLALAEPLGPGQHTRELELDGRDRSYIVHLPASYDAESPTPVVLAFHGAGMNADLMIPFSGLSDAAEKHGFIVVYPNGVGVGPMLTFNAGGFVGRRSGNWADDVAFTSALLDDLAGVASVDPRRIFATGMSNGGMMVYRLGVELADRIAAIAPVAGTLAIADPEPTRPVPVMHFHGRADTIVPWDGPSRRTPQLVDFRSVKQSVAFWVAHNGCVPEPEITDIPVTEEDGTSVRRLLYRAGDTGAEVILYEIRGGGHTWPGVRTMPNFIGRTTTQISANDLMWDFFQRHPMPEPADNEPSSPGEE